MKARSPKLALATTNGKSVQPPAGPGHSPHGGSLAVLADRLDGEHHRLVCEIGALLDVCIRALPEEVPAGGHQVRNVLLLIEEALSRATEEIEDIAGDVRQIGGTE